MLSLESKRHGQLKYGTVLPVRRYRHGANPYNWHRISVRIKCRYIEYMCALRVRLHASLLSATSNALCISTGADARGKAGNCGK